MGRPKGAPNKATSQARSAIAAFVDDNTPLLKQLLKEIHKKDGPAAAFDRIVTLIEYHVPKLARHELTGADGVPLVPLFAIGLEPQMQPRTIDVTPTHHVAPPQLPQDASGDADPALGPSATPTRTEDR
jgi:hypothetical protein